LAPSAESPISGWLVPPVPILIVGTAWNMMDDFLRARNRLEGIPHRVWGINRTCQFIATDFNFTLDRDNASYWKSVAINKDAIWASAQPGATRRLEDYPWIDLWLSWLAGSGTSAWAACKYALETGDNEVILCGVPLEPGPYADGVIGRSFDGMTGTLNKFRQIIVEQSKSLDVSRVRSMSGWTKEFFGEFK
tara:strand:- start:459 stop:1034 length:576 start_codon:yes stop_codon:yes gene_type:complete